METDKQPTSGPPNMDVTLSPKCQSVMDVHISQIPGLSPTIEAEDRAHSQRGRIHDSDSDYIKLAKQGGHKGLLWHEDAFEAKAASYKPPDWFCAASELDSTTCKERENAGSFLPLQPPFGNDSMSAWERGDTGGTGSEKNTSVLPSREPAALQTSSHGLTTKYKRVVFNKKRSPPEMSKLLSHSYAEDDDAKVKTNLQD
ncbi:uncharacterized protein C7orf57-like isoform X2 [Nelusetta ayraudi]|uniref:uncharacterized protein C7orf57-like isoform X2 n=1 Tax=Nelusetta ayraudi TaxID=303726 RepID=UPI003F705D52